MGERVLGLLQLLFDGPGEPRAWWPFLEALGAAISPDVAVVTVMERAAPEPATVMSGSGFQRVAPGRLPRRGDAGPRIEYLPAGTVFVLPQLAALGKNSVVRGLLEPEGLLPGPALGMVLANEGGHAQGLLLALPRRPGWAPKAADRTLFDRLAPFVTRAVRLHLQILGGNALTSLLDHLALGVLLLDERGEIAYSNRSAAELLGVEPGLNEWAHGARSEALKSLTGGALAGGDRLYRHPVDGRAIHVIETVLTWPMQQGMTPARFSRALFLADPKLASGEPIEALGAAYGFTASETRLAWLLAGDLTLAEAASRLAITESTARTVLKRLLAKTGTRRQASLVRLLLSGPAQLRGPRPAPGRRGAARRRHIRR